MFRFPAISTARKRTLAAARAGLGACCSALLLAAPAISQAAEDADSERIALSEPRAFPDTLAFGATVAEVQFKVYGFGDPGRVELQETTRGGVYPLNDAGRAGDRVARDGIFGATLTLDLGGLASGDCLRFEAVAPKHSRARSPVASLCLSALPTRMSPVNRAASNRVLFANGAGALADEVLVRFATGVGETQILSIADAIGAEVVGGIRKRRLYQLRFGRSLPLPSLQSIVTGLEALAAVENAAFNSIGNTQADPNDPEFSMQHGPQHIRADQVWDIAAGAGVTITVLDSGIDSGHPEFNRDGAGCKLVGMIGGCDQGDNDVTGHGTAVAGIAAAFRDNGIGIAGVASDSLVDPIRISNAIDVPMSEMLQGLQDAAAFGVGKIVNASFAIRLPEAPMVEDPNAADPFDLCAALDDVVVSDAGLPLALVVNAVGNHNSGGWAYPARCNDDSAPANAGLTRKDLFVVVGNSVSCVEGDPCTNEDRRHSSSNYGPFVDLFAPGTDIRTITNTGYGNLLGSSFSAPMVAGTAAILHGCGVPLEQLENVMTGSATVLVPYPPGGAPDPAFPSGSTPRVDTYGALQSVNTAPSGISGVLARIDEGTDSSGGLELGGLISADSDSCDLHAYSILPVGDHGLFRLEGDALDELVFENGVIGGAPDSYSVTVRGSDFFGESVDQVFVLTINRLPNADAGADRVYDEGDTVGLDGGGSSDPDGSIAAYTWTQVDASGVTVTLLDADTATAAFTAPAVTANTTLRFSLVVTDNDGASSASDSVEITLEPVQAPPPPPPADEEDPVDAEADNADEADPGDATETADGADESDDGGSGAASASPALLIISLLLVLAARRDRKRPADKFSLE